MELQKKAEDFLNKYFADYEKVYIAQGSTYWQAANSGKKEDFDALPGDDYESVEELIADGWQVD